MSADLAQSLTIIAQRLVVLASEDDELRTHLRHLAQAILEATNPPEPSQTDLLLGDVQVPGEAKVGDTPALTDSVVSSSRIDEAPLPELLLGRSRMPSIESVSPPAMPSSFSSEEIDLSIVEARCRLKAKGARWAATRRHLISAGAAFTTEIEPFDKDIISRAKSLPDCFLWMCHFSGPSPSNPSLYVDVAGCFDAVADVVGVLRQIEHDPDTYSSFFEKCLDLLAEAQSALRVAISTIDGPFDTDQAAAFNWLKSTASRMQIYISRYMRADDSAAPSRFEDLSARIEAIDTSLQEAMTRAKSNRKRIGKVRHKASLITSENGETNEHWRILVATVEELVGDGLPPSNKELRDLLVPIIDSLPGEFELPKGFKLVLREIDSFVAGSAPPIARIEAQPSQEVREVAELLTGRSVVLIGGDRRNGSSQALKDAFGLRELFWIETREHQSTDVFAPFVAKPEVDLVLLAIRWSSHSYGDVRELCERHRKAFARLPGGYNPNQVAAQIMNQCSQLLRDKKNQSV